MTTKNWFSVVAVLGAMVVMGGCGGGDAKPAVDPSSSAPASSAASTAADGDGDGIPDGADKCPDKKEDGQAPDPKDGCPKS
jgi:hypothetical protein